jgi:hypothetical protein
LWRCAAASCFGKNKDILSYLLSGLTEEEVGVLDGAAADIRLDAEALRGDEGQRIECWDE